MQLAGALLALVGTALIELAVLQAATAMFGDSLVLALVIGIAGVVLLAPGGWMMLHEHQP
jgi:hypothetical protein